MPTASKREAALKLVFLILIALGVVIGLGWAIFSGDEPPTSEAEIETTYTDGEVIDPTADIVTTVDDAGNVIESDDE